MKEGLENILKEARELSEKINTEKDLENFRIKFLGRKGLLNEFLKKFVNLPLEEKREIGRYFNYVKEEVQKLLESAQERVVKEEKIKFDIHHPGIKIKKGHKHILIENIQKICHIFNKLGFEIELGREIVTEDENFNLLNIPPHHPSRDLWDTLWIKNNKNKLLLRTHTSAHQIEILKNKNVPLKVIIPGKVYRHEATDQRHEMQFYQLEGLSVDHSSNLKELKGVLKIFFSEYLGKPVKVIFRSSFFPFTEPSLEVDIECILCRSKGCPVCKNTGYLEVAGAGMIHSVVLRNAGIDSHKYFGYAFGLGIERLVMLKYNIQDIRLFHSADLRFIHKF